MDYIIRLMPEPIPSMAAEIGRLSRLSKQVSETLRIGKPDDVTEEYWIILTDYRNALVDHKYELDKELGREIKLHQQDLDNSSDPTKDILDRLGKGK
jgi:hypothetical protein